MLDSMLFLAAADPLEHVVDRAIGGQFSGGLVSPDVFFSYHITYMLIAAVICCLLLPFVAHRIAADGTGGRLGGFFESILLFIRDDVVRPFVGEEGDKYLWIIWTFFFFILFCNLLGMLPKIGLTATASLSVNAALASISFLIYHGVGIKKNGLLKYLKANFLVGPPFLWPLMIIIEAMGHVIKPCALAIRLLANMVAGHLLLAVILGLSSGAVSLVTGSAVVALTFLEILVACIQAFIFTFLTTVFLGMAIHPDH